MRKIALLSTLLPFFATASAQEDGTGFRLRFQEANQCAWGVTIPVNTTHNGGNRHGSLQERNYGLIWTCWMQENYPASILDMKFEKGFQFGSFRNSQNQPLSIVGPSTRVRVFGLTEPLFHKEISFFAGAKIFVASYGLRNGKDSVIAPLLTWSRGVEYRATQHLTLGLLEEVPLGAGVRTRMVTLAWKM